MRSRIGRFGWLIAVVMLAAAGWLHAQAPATVLSGTKITVVLDRAVSSKDAQVGQTVPATVVESVKVGREIVIPRGARARLLVVDAKPSGRLKQPAKLYLRLNSIDVNGAVYRVKSDVDGQTGPSHKGRDAKSIGGGTAAGAIIGAIAGGGKGAAIGAAAGAGAGTGVAAATGKKDITYAAETKLRFRLKDDLRVR